MKPQRIVILGGTGFVGSHLVPRLHALLIQAEAMRVEDAAVFGPSWRDLYRKEGAGPGQPWWIARRGELIEVAGKGTPRYVYHRSTVSARAPNGRSGSMSIGAV